MSSESISEPPHGEQNDSTPQYDGKGDKQGEFQMLGLVAEGVHGDLATNTASKKAEEKQGALGNAPLAPFCPAFVNTKDNESYQIYE